MATNTLGEFSDGEDDFVFEIDENLWNNDDDDDDLIRNINEEEVLSELYGNNDDELIRNIDEDEVLTEVAQTGRGEKRKNDEQSLPAESLPGEYYYNIESVKKHHSKKFRMTATDHTVRFNNVLANLDLLESHERTQAIFHHLIADVT